MRLAEESVAAQRLSEDVEPPPCFVLCAARTGSTLLRRVLDAHPDIYCPAEMNVASICQAMHFFVEGASQETANGCRDADQLSRDVVRSAVGAAAAAEGKRRWCDKSLSSIDNAQLLKHVFPESTFICLYRQCADVIASAIDATPWGFGGGGPLAGYGYESYVRDSPRNFVFALAAYWADKTAAALEFQRSYPDQTYSVRYEDLVRNPVSTLEQLYRWLGENWDETFADPKHIFGRPSSRDGLGDHKAAYTSQFDAGAGGRGWTIPLELIHPNLMARVDALNAELGYPTLEGDVVPGCSFHADGARGVESTSPHSADLSRIRLRIQERVARGDSGTKRPTLQLMLVDSDVNWLIDPGRDLLFEGRREADCTIVTDAATLVGLAEGTRNAGRALRRGTLRIGPGGDGDLRQLRSNDFLDELLRYVSPDRTHSAANDCEEPTAQPVGAA
ncbi:MAG TPA: sulfotransferase [Gaiellaceae bacterium]|nr:sulfotransferase [Gaiellaceae bacterium]